MQLEIESDLSLEFEGHGLSLRNEEPSLVAEFSSLSALRRLRRTFPMKPGPLPKPLQMPGLEGLSARVVVRGRTIAVVGCTGQEAVLRTAWWSLLATILHLPSR